MTAKQCFNCQHEGQPLICLECIHNCLLEVKNDHFKAKIVEIRPEKAGELWAIRDTSIFTYKDVYGDSLELKFIYADGSGKSYIAGHANEQIRHNKNGWTRLYPLVEDENIERIEIEGVEWFDGRLTKSGRYGPLVIYPETGLSRAKELEFVNGPPMKMILEIPKDKP